MHKSFDYGEEILIINQNSPKSVLYSYFGGFKHLVYYNLIVCYSFGLSFSHLVC